MNIHPDIPWPIIGINGLARAGKDTIGKILIENHGFTRVAFADGVRDAALALNPWIWDDQSATPVRLSQVIDQIGWDKAKAIAEVRRTLQRIGSEAGWMIHGQDLWIDLAAKKITGPTVITDLRFAHEVTWLDSIGGQFWKVERPSNKLALTGDVAKHSSEAGELGREPDAIIINDRSLEELSKTVDALITSLNQ